MKKRQSDNSKSNQQEKMIEQALKTSGFLFPETVEEVKEFERIYGTTDVILPVELKEPTFIYPFKRKQHKKTKTWKSKTKERRTKVLGK